MTDPTGARRFWPVKTTDIDIDLLVGLRDQLFAEAVVRYRQDEKWWPDHEFERQHIVPEQEQRQEDDVWEEPIVEYVTSRPKVSIYKIARRR